MTTWQRKAAITMLLVGFAMLATTIPIVLLVLSPHRLVWLILLVVVPCGLAVSGMWLFLMGVVLPQIWRRRQ